MPEHYVWCLCRWCRDKIGGQNLFFNEAGQRECIAASLGLMLKSLDAGIRAFIRTEMSLSDVALQFAPRAQSMAGRGKMEPWSQHNEYSFMTESESPLGTDGEAPSLHGFNTFSNERVVYICSTRMLNVWRISDGVCFSLQQARWQPSPRLSGIRFSYRAKSTLTTCLPWLLHV